MTSLQRSDVVQRVGELGGRVETTVEWEDCRYRAIKLRKTMAINGKPSSEGVLVLAPGAMISFRSDATELDSGAVFSYALEALE